MKTNIRKGTIFVFVLLCILCCSIGVSATAQGTNGDELQVITPEKLEIHLGQEWAGVNFELSTDYGKYPNPIPVGDDGALRLEIGGSTNYILTRVYSTNQAPTPSETISSETTPDTGLTENNTETLIEIEFVESTEFSGNENTIAGIPAMHLVLFGSGLIIAVGVLVGINLVQKRRAQSNRNFDGENDEF